MERERQISYINAYMWNLERQYRQSYVQGSNRDKTISQHGEEEAGEKETSKEGGRGEKGSCRERDALGGEVIGAVGFYCSIHTVPTSHINRPQMPGIQGRGLNNPPRS